jgi:hypothetical protein
VHTPVPVAHWTVATDAQRFGEAQSAPCVQATHVPALQTWFVPQDVPFAAVCAVSWHTGAPDAQEMAPTMQGLPGGVQAVPAVQLTHWPPAAQTRFVPHAVPAGWKVTSVQIGLPLAQEIAAETAQGLAEVQLAPALQAPQAPAAVQARPAPQAVPAGWNARSVHTGEPLPHS